MDFLVLTKTGGFLGPIANILGYIMDALFRFTSSMGIVNIGLCIILFTLVIKILMFPLTLKQQKSSKLMAVMQPELQAIQAKYKGKKDNDSMMKMNAETKAVYDKYGTNMMGGCLQLLIQMPILFALYRVIYNIPAYVASVRVYFDNIVAGITTQPDYINKISGLADAAKMPIDRFDLTTSDRMVDLLYKFTPEQWGTLQNIFPTLTDLIRDNAGQIERMNSFLGINLATSPWNGFVPSVAWLIPIMAGLSQWYSTKLMTANQAPGSEDAPGASMMKQMNVTMPLMSAAFCFTFPAGIGIYWIATSVVQIIQQIGVNMYLDRVDMDELIKKNIEKANKKREKKGLPPNKISQSVNYKAIKQEEQVKLEKRAQKVEQSKEIAKESTSYYNDNAKPGSLASKAGMVQKYNEKHNK